MHTATGTPGVLINGLSGTSIPQLTFLTVTVIRSSSFVSTFCPSTAKYEGRTESRKQLFFACELGTADEGECGGRWNQLLCYP